LQNGIYHGGKIGGQIAGHLFQRCRLNPQNAAGGFDIYV
jgi:hypothetical protein